MAIDPNVLPVVSLAAMKKAERKRAEEATFLTLVPGTAATRAAFGALAVGTVAKDSLRRERKAAAAVISALEAIVGGQPATAAFAAQPALRDLAPDTLAAQFTAAVDRDDGGRTTRAVAGESGESTKELWNALGLATEMLIEAIGRTKNLLFTADEAEPFDDYLDLLPGADRDKIVRPAGED
ncbi:hypothetical protein GCM10011376_08630 [Nocardioides flavus (ex Wang et al. 2016)]|uniref:Uncharacterized protein n=1 Tax=Nocardioides flavus (ex Wang et al. 2016) TaxID=2058780 RepID=A0ABQ3HF87_9ACTN|nr:hypothetical protein [Nocardioides flavus (ex Wang et al. 2016)]GHE16253.1 hypothetical protein GCM10011376_08630 [Nocardioides flavus (ex Wang et al. 2016)]